MICKGRYSRTLTRIHRILMTAVLILRVAASFRVWNGSWLRGGLIRKTEDSPISNSNFKHLAPVSSRAHRNRAAIRHSRVMHNRSISRDLRSSPIRAFRHRSHGVAMHLHLNLGIKVLLHNLLKVAMHLHLLRRDMLLRHKERMICRSTNLLLFAEAGVVWTLRLRF